MPGSGTLHLQMGLELPSLRGSECWVGIVGSREGSSRSGRSLVQSLRMLSELGCQDLAPVATGSVLYCSMLPLDHLENGDIGGDLQQPVITLPCNLEEGTSLLGLTVRGWEHGTPLLCHLPEHPGGEDCADGAMESLQSQLPDELVRRHAGTFSNVEPARAASPTFLLPGSISSSDVLPRPLHCASPRV